MPGPKAFRTPDAFRAWLERNHARDVELVVRCYRQHAGDRGMTYRQALDEALCFGWIDGVRRSVDAFSFSVRFTPRREGSRWSAVNVRHATRLEAEGRMRPAGLAAFRARDRATGYSYESRPVELEPALLKTLRGNARAWAFFQSRPPWYRRTSSFWVMSATRPETRARRFELLVTCSERGTTIPLLTRPAGTGGSR